MAAVVGAILAAGGIGYAGVQSVRKTGDIRVEEEQGTYRGRFMDVSHVVNDEHAKQWNPGEIDSVTTGTWGIKKTNYKQPGKGIISGYGLPKGNSLSNS